MGIALATAISAWVNAILLFIVLRMNKNFILDSQLITNTFKIFISVILMALGCYFLNLIIFANIQDLSLLFKAGNLFLIIVCIFTDIGGYLFGKILKGPKLTKISPNKTYSGVVGSFFISLITGFIYIKYLGQKSKILLNNDLEFVVLLILFISLISQIGDLIISYFKRQAKLKDTGKILPGHGGFLDRLDGIIFVIPVIYLTIIPI